MRTGFKNALVLFVLLIMLGPAVKNLAAMNRWQTYTSHEGGYSVSLPGRPQEDFRRVPGQFKSVLVRYVAAQAPDGSGVYGVGYTDLPAAVSDPYAPLQRMEAIAAALKGRLVSSSDVTVDGHPGREYQVQRDRAVTTLRAFVVGRRLYQLMVTSSTGDNGDGQRGRFMASFRLLTAS
jgi:hypothetical protein